MPPAPSKLRTGNDTGARKPRWSRRQSPRGSEDRQISCSYDTVSREIGLSAGRIVSTHRRHNTGARPHHSSEAARLEYDQVLSTDNAIVGNIWVADVPESLAVHVELARVRHQRAVVLHVDPTVGIDVRRSAATVVRIAASKNLRTIQEAVTIRVRDQWVRTGVVWIDENPGTGFNGVEQPVVIIIKITNVAVAITVEVGLLEVKVDRTVVADGADAISIGVGLIGIECLGRERTVIVAFRGIAACAQIIAGYPAAFISTDVVAVVVTALEVAAIDERGVTKTILAGIPVGGCSPRRWGEPRRSMLVADRQAGSPSRCGKSRVLRR